MEQLTLDVINMDIIVNEGEENSNMDERISGTKAMQMLELSRHSFEKVVKNGWRIQVIRRNIICFLN